MKRRQIRRKLIAGVASLLSVAAVALFAYTGDWLELAYTQTALNAPITSTLEDSPLRVHFLDVGQGDCVLVQTPSQNILIDAGEAENAPYIAKYLRAQGVNRLDLAVATHPHSDHIGALYETVVEFDAQSVLTPSVPKELLEKQSSFLTLADAFESGELVQLEAVADDVYDLGDGVTMTILGPLSDDYNDLNLFSIVCRIDYEDVSILLTGDMEAKNEIELLERYGAQGLHADLLKLGHHGSKTSSTARWLDAVHPSVAVAGIGADNDYGHPHAGVVERLVRRNITFYRTDLHGAVVCGTDGTQLSIVTEKTP